MGHSALVHLHIYEAPARVIKVGPSQLPVYDAVIYRPNSGRRARHNRLRLVHDSY
jgi:hypothetical protein